MTSTKTLFSILTVLALGSGCTATGGSKEISPPHAPVVTQAQIDSDTQALAEMSAELATLGLEFELKTRYDHSKIANWKPGRVMRENRAAQITALDRFIEMGESYLLRYQLYTLDGRIQSLDEPTKAELTAKLELARAKLSEFRASPSAS
jgi:hypothetical protein